MRVVSVNLYQYADLLPDAQKKAWEQVAKHIATAAGTGPGFLDRVNLALAMNMYEFQVDGTLFRNADVPAEWEG